MTAVKTSSVFLGILSVATIGLLTACGERASSEAPVGSATEKISKTNCFNTVGRLIKNDAELFDASGAGDIHRVEQSIAAGGNVNATDSLKRTPLFAAAYCNNPEVTNLLIDKGGDVNARDFIGMSPLHAAVVVGWGEVATALILRGANIDIRSIAGRTPLHVAAATDQVEMVELLMEHGANSQVPDKDGNSAASLASNNSHPAVVVAINKWQGKQKNPMQK